MSKLIKTDNGSLVKLQDIARKLATSISSTELATKLAAQLAITDAEALELLNNTKLESAIHDALVDKIVGGSLAIKAMEVLNTKMNQGNLQAASLVLGFNKCLKSNTVKSISNLTVNSNNALISLDKQAIGLLEGEND